MSYEPHFQLNQSFARSRRGGGDTLFEALIPLVTLDNKIYGSVIYEKPNSGEIILNWYETNIGNDNLIIKTKENKSAPKPPMSYPQEPLQQSWIVDYPILAYNCTNPDNREITLVHLAQKMP